ncbi:MAG: MXAN_5187 C-terminal domain-containing protein [Candidatus Acidiferrales bacterium]
MATIDEDLNQLERDVRQLKIEFEQYFGGGKKRPPTEIEWRIDTMLKRHGDRGADMNYSQRFRYSNLAQTYAKYRDIFRKRLKQKEEATSQRHFGAAAREIEMARAAKQSTESNSNGETKFPFTISCIEPDKEMPKVEQLYAAFRRAKEKAGEDTGKLTIEAFQRFLRQKTEQIKRQESASEVEYIVTVEDNQARLKARAKQ